ncbi:Uncharacterized protein SCF082_LOCUS11153 [Durusdinium trenchii]|uniref:Histidine phosphatase family protein n=1 Tax=Durusdinium trenchii TaxID=1381693 RepID=A0ABP0JAZ6_9DINO
MDAVQGQTVRKTLFLIRHAESMENEKLGSLKKFFHSIGRLELPEWAHFYHGVSIVGEPSLVDSTLSTKGKKQVERLTEILREENFVDAHGVELVMHSPLIRAAETAKAVFHSMPKETADHFPRFVEPLIREKFISEWVNLGGLDKRIADFAASLVERSEERIVVVGHSQYFRRMLGQEKKMSNCDVWHVELEIDPASKEHRWVNLRKLHDVQVDDDQ